MESVYFIVKSIAIFKWKTNNLEIPDDVHFADIARKFDNE